MALSTSRALLNTTCLVAGSMESERYLRHILSSCSRLSPLSILEAFEHVGEIFRKVQTGRFPIRKYRTGRCRGRRGRCWTRRAWQGGWPSADHTCRRWAHEFMRHSAQWRKVGFMARYTLLVPTKRPADFMALAVAAMAATAVSWALKLARRRVPKSLNMHPPRAGAWPSAEDTSAKRRSPWRLPGPLRYNIIRTRWPVFSPP